MPPAEAKDYQKQYQMQIENMGFLWIGDSTWGIEFQYGKLKQLDLVKG